MNFLKFKEILCFLFLCFLLFSCGGSDNAGDNSGDNGGNGDITGETVVIISEGFGSDYDSSNYYGGQFVIENEVAVETTALTYVIVEQEFSKIIISMDVYFDTMNKQILTKIFSEPNEPSGHITSINRDVIGLGVFTTELTELAEQTEISLNLNIVYNLTVTFDVDENSLNANLTLNDELVYSGNLRTTFTSALNLIGFEIERGAFLDNLTISIES